MTFVTFAVTGPVWPEYAELDCFACHHSLTRAEDSWCQAHGYENRARPGLPSITGPARGGARRRRAPSWSSWRCWAWPPPPRRGRSCGRWLFRQAAG